MEELYRSTLLLHDQADELTARYSERQANAAAEVVKTTQKALQ